MTVQSIFYSSNYFWVSDGTATGTQSILGAPLQINPNLITFGNYVIFDVQSINGGGIYKTDGTTAGTQLLASFTKFADSARHPSVLS